MSARLTSTSTEELVTLGRAAGLTAVGVAPAVILEPARSTLHLRKRAGLAGEMQFTYRNPDRSTDPERFLPGARSLVAGAWGYGDHRRPPPRPDPAEGGPQASVARYSWYDHYHDLEQALQPMADRLIAAGHRARVVADSNALVDRNAAWAAGLGWYGKNSNLLLPGAGSWFVLGAVVTDADLEPTGPPLADGCGSCNQCIEDCPTDAIVAPGVVDATRCLAWLVQAGGPIPARYRVAVGDRIYGCDDCQDVCPPNRSLDRSLDRQQELRPALGRQTGPGVRDGSRVDLFWVLTATDREVLDRHGRWYIADRNVDVIRRTALVVLGNTASPDHGPRVGELLAHYLTHANPLLRAHAVWAARRLGRTDLLTSARVEADPESMVTDELDFAVEPRFELGEWHR